MEVQKILNHRKKYNKTEYLVKWRNLPKTHNEWVSEQDFSTTEIISRHWKSLEKKNNLSKPIKRNNSRRIQRANFVNH